MVISLTKEIDMTIYGYARVSTHHQDTAVQLAALNKYGCDVIYTEHESGAKRHRPELEALLSQLQQGDVIVVYKLDRLARSMLHLTQVVADLRSKGVGFVSLTELIDLTSPLGEFLFHILGAVAQFERAVILERTQAGIRYARERGVKFGRPKIYSDDVVELVNDMLAHGVTYRDIAALLGIPAGSMYTLVGKRNK